MSHWWRAYDQAVDDPKLQCLAPPLFKAWFNLMCIASESGGTLPAIGAVAFKLRIGEHKAAEIIAALVAAGLIDRRPDGKFEPHNWAVRQYVSDVSTPRVKRFRERQRNGAAAVSETPPESESDSDAERENARETRALSRQDFDEQVWKPYPRTPVMSKEQAWKAWQKAREEDRAAIVAAIPRYAAWLRRQTPDYPVLNIGSFIAQRRFDGFAEAERAPARTEGFHAAAESPQLAAWDAHWRATRGHGLPRDKHGGWRVETEWPPGHAGAAATAATVPDDEAAA